MGKVSDIMFQNTVWDIEDYLEKIEYSRKNISLDEFEELNTGFWTYPLNEGLTIKRVMEHFEVFLNSIFLFSADTEKEIENELRSQMSLREMQVI